MPYDYSKQYLEANADVVQLVDEAYRTRTVYKRSFLEPRDMTREQLKVNNILRSLAINYPDQYVEVRKTVRTWTEYADGVWILYIGAARHKIQGRKPGPTAVTSWSPYVAATVAPTPEVYEHDRLIDGLDEFQRFAGIVLELAETTRQVQAEFTDVLENLEPFVAMFGDLWTVEASSPTTLTLRRK